MVAITKYVAGHSDLVMGAVAAGPRCADQLWRDATLLGQTVSPDEAYNALKGLRSAAARLAMHTAHADEVVAWLKQQPQVKRILYPHPPLPEDPGHALWRRDFKGANGLLSIEFAPPIAPAAADRFVDSLRLFGIVASWGATKAWRSLSRHSRLARRCAGAAAHRLGGPSRSHRQPGAGFPRRLGLAGRSPCQP